MPGLSLFSTSGLLSLMASSFQRRQKEFCGGVSKEPEVFGSGWGGTGTGQDVRGKSEICVCMCCFSSLLHNGAFREPLLKGIATAFV